ncbi:MAG: hypothetical protein K2P80_12220 [Beijerinckiaceae bacterium]|nr:hypothetical protein [Beijerinckiaceae bacterium]
MGMIPIAEEWRAVLAWMLPNTKMNETNPDPDGIRHDENGLFSCSALRSSLFYVLMTVEASSVRAVDTV